jgi:hypothetical protein
MDVDALIAGARRKSRTQGCPFPRFTGDIREFIDGTAGLTREEISVQYQIGAIRALGGSISEKAAYKHYNAACGCE